MPISKRLFRFHCSSPVDYQVLKKFIYQFALTKSSQFWQAEKVIIYGILPSVWYLQAKLHLCRDSSNCEIKTTTGFSQATSLRAWANLKLRFVWKIFHYLARRRFDALMASFIASLSSSQKIDSMNVTYNTLLLSSLKLIHFCSFPQALFLWKRATYFANLPFFQLANWEKISFQLLSDPKQLCFSLTDG